MWTAFWGDYRSLLPPVCQRRLNRIVGQAWQLGKKKQPPPNPMPATFGGVRRVFEAGTFRSLNLLDVVKGSKMCFQMDRRLNITSSRFACREF
jgi:hypothetical protein